MKKKILAALAVLSLLLTSFPACAKESDALYYGEVTRRYGDSYTKVYSRMDKESPALDVYDPGKDILITAVYPAWVEIDMGRKKGYILRNRIDVEAPVDPVSTPPYGVEVNQFYTVIDREVNLYAEKDRNSTVLSAFTPGAKVSFIGVEEGWAKLVYKRQYGYVHTGDLKVLYPVCQSAEMCEDTDVPIAVFTSFYNDKPARIKNLQVCCERMNRVMMPGDVLDFNESVGPFTVANGYFLAPGLKDGKVIQSPGGGSCQVSSTLYNTILQLPGITVVERHPHGANAAPYLPHGVDASSGVLNFRIKNSYPFPIRIEGSIHDFALFIAVYREAE